ncbi:ligase-associated DNA damage response endonuclease PdeM [Flavobacterium selenitireducens]|uniref:ligase-associated DNA damage response endonuclease PdeM n=1 Tax=Flavobacterium selenitireducens TaxID=2722704 RepID=UPI00168B2CCD|nr:ligase-associated DNA damage response endonuclease PdeM [Flavobacterium selenitireducens]MBD3581354.1 ligase-associated DNA damage response endonuclease PdeM [Flavobacterium selenitireducens]
MIQEITIHGNHFVLHASGAVFWKERNMLLISDVHLGKVSHFRKHGIALPKAAFTGNFERLTAVADYFQAEIVCFLGDLFHSSLNSEWDVFSDWVNSRPENFLLIIGNHDILQPEKYESIGMAIASELKVGNFLFTHEPEEQDGYFTFCGHIHPGINLRGAGRQSMDLPCFFQSKNQMILPAFGEFTGKWIMEPCQGDLIYGIAGNEIFAVPVRERKRRFS